MKRIILDQGLSPLAAMLLRAEGWDVLHVLDVGLDRAEDAEILDFALRESRTCVTLDHDFHSHLARSRTAGPSVVFVRLEGMAGREQADLIRRIWSVCEDEITEGAAVTVDARSIRVRKLPLR